MIQTLWVGAVFPGVRLAGTAVAPTCFLISSGNPGETEQRFSSCYRWRELVQREIVNSQIWSWWPGNRAGECSLSPRSWLGRRELCAWRALKWLSLHTLHTPNTFCLFNSFGTFCFLFSLSNWRLCKAIITESVAFSLHSISCLRAWSVPTSPHVCAHSPGYGPSVLGSSPFTSESFQGMGSVTVTSRLAAFTCELGGSNWTQLIWKFTVFDREKNGGRKDDRYKAWESPKRGFFWKITTWPHH